MHVDECVLYCARVYGMSVCASVSFAYFDEGLLTSDSTGIDSQKSLDDFLLANRPYWTEFDRRQHK